MKLSELLPKVSCDLTKAKTGQPFECMVYRGQYKQSIDRDRGIFYTPHLNIAKQYGPERHLAIPNQPANEQGHLIKKKLRLLNPFVCGGTTEALQYLVKNGVVDNNLAQKIADFGAYANPIAERSIASGMRKIGHDAIIYVGLDEVVHLG